MPSPHRLVLLVEDDEDLRGMVREALLDLGCGVVEASNAEDALRRLAENDDIVLLFTDIRMPGRLDGIDLAREAKHRRPDLEILYTTAYADWLPLEENDAIGGRLLRKPYRLNELRDQVLDLVGS